LRALGNADPPLRVQIGGICCQRRDVLKHDSWAATAVYAADDGRQFICKFNRQQSLLGLPMRWLGRFLARRETYFLRALGDLPNVPNSAGEVVVEDQALPNAVARHYIAGHPLAVKERVGDEFFPRLKALLAQLHLRGIAYVDLHKRENVIVGDDGQPYLIDFQISQALGSRLPLVGGLMAMLMHILQRSDCYHLDKMHWRSRPDQFPPGGWDIGAQRPWWIRIYRLVGVPLRTCRRWMLVRLGVRSGRGKPTSEHFPEDAFRAIVPDKPQAIEA
jgi:hypothetical protein